MEWSRRGLREELQLQLRCVCACIYISFISRSTALFTRCLSVHTDHCVSRLDSTPLFCYFQPTFFHCLFLHCFYFITSPSTPLVCVTMLSIRRCPLLHAVCAVFVMTIRMAREREEEPHACGLIHSATGGEATIHERDKERGEKTKKTSETQRVERVC